MANKFQSNLTASNAQIKADRARRLSQDVEIEVDALVGQKRREVSALENHIDNLTDLGPDSITSLLKTEKAGLNAANWVTSLHKAKVDLKIKKLELEVALEIKEEWFTDLPEKE